MPVNFHSLLSACKNLEAQRVFNFSHGFHLLYSRLSELLPIWHFHKCCGLKKNYISDKSAGCIRCPWNHTFSHSRNFFGWEYLWGAHINPFRVFINGLSNTTLGFVFSLRPCFTGTRSHPIFHIWSLSWSWFGEKQFYLPSLTLLAWLYSLQSLFTNCLPISFWAEFFLFSTLSNVVTKQHIFSQSP